MVWHRTLNQLLLEPLNTRSSASSDEGMAAGSGTSLWPGSAAATVSTYSTSLGCRRQPSLACHAWNHGKSPKSSPLSQQCRFHCHTWSAGESHYCVNSKGFMKFGTHTNEESDEYQQKWLPLSEFVGLCSKYIAIPYGSMAFILKNLPFQITRCF